MAQVFEGLIPRPEEFVAVLFCDVKNVVGLVSAETLGESEFKRIEPELRGAVIALNVDVRRLEPVCHVEEEAKTAFA